MVLVLTNSLDATAEHLVPILERAGIELLRLDTDKLVPRATGAYRTGRAELQLDGHTFCPDDVDHIWYRRPERLAAPLFDDSPEGNYARLEWTEFLECFLAHVPIPKWMNHPSRNVAASRKLEQLTIAEALGFRVPNTLATQEPAALREFYEQHGGMLIAKPLSTGYVERPEEDCDTLIYTNRVLESHLASLADLENCPTLFQHFIQKQYDVRITVVDEDMHAIELQAPDSSGGQRCDIRRNNMSDVSYQEASVPPDVGSNDPQAHEALCLRFGAIDMAVTTEGEWIFFEINPNGQWAWLDLTAGTCISDSFVRSFSA
jgi:hypothetical protein